MSEFVTHTSTEQAYAQWVHTFVKWHGLRHPRDMGHVAIERFLGMLANERRIAAATHNQALSALLFLYREVLGIDLPWLDAVQRPRTPRRIGLALAAWLNDSFGAFIWMAAQGRKREFVLGRSSQRCGADCRARVLRSLNLVQLTFVFLAVAKSGDRLVALSVSSASRSDGLHPLRSGP